METTQKQEDDLEFICEFKAIKILVNHRQGTVELVQDVDLDSQCVSISLSQVEPVVAFLSGAAQQLRQGREN